MRALLPFVVPFLTLSAFLPPCTAYQDIKARQANAHYPRQAGTVASSPSTPTMGAVITPTTGVGGSPTGSVISANTTTGNITSLPTVSFSLESTNPTAVPLSSIVSGASSAPTSPLASTPVAGSVPTYLPNAPGLPDLSNVRPSNYPALDKVPPTDSPEVQQWITDVHNSGVQIPNISQTVAGGCPANPAAAADPTRCWWTCGGCTRKEDITDCPTHLEWGLTYDDGPAYHTTQLLAYLDQVQLKSTFFVVGSRVISFPAILQSEYMNEHQIAVHTWSHPPLTTLTNEQIIAELGWSKKVIKDVLGVTPNMMRPPYGDIDDRVRAISVAMGLAPVIWTRVSPTVTFDTGDFNIAGGTISVSQVLYNWENIIGNATGRSSGFIVLEHDLFQQSVEVATGYILPDAIAHQFTIKPVVSCLGRTYADAYIELNDNSTNVPLILQPGVVNLTSTPSGIVQSTGTSHKSAGSRETIAGFAIAGSTTLVGLLAGMALVL